VDEIRVGHLGDAQVIETGVVGLGGRVRPLRTLPIRLEQPQQDGVRDDRQFVDW
jgi:hypothetical protein